MKSTACAESALTKNQLHVVRLSRGTGHFRATGIFSRRASAAMRPSHNGACGAAGPGLPRSRGASLPQGHAYAHRSLFSHKGLRHILGCILGSCAAAWLDQLGVGVRVANSPRPLLASWGSGEMSISGVWGEMGKRSPSGLRPAVGISGAGALALMRAPAKSLLGWAM